MHLGPHATLPWSYGSQAPLVRNNGALCKGSATATTVTAASSALVQRTKSSAAIGGSIGDRGENASRGYSGEACTGSVPLSTSIKMQGSAKALLARAEIVPCLCSGGGGDRWCNLRGGAGVGGSGGVWGTVGRGAAAAWRTVRGRRGGNGGGDSGGGRGSRDRKPRHRPESTGNLIHESEGENTVKLSNSTRRVSEIASSSGHEVDEGALTTNAAGAEEDVSEAQARGGGLPAHATSTSSTNNSSKKGSTARLTDTKADTSGSRSRKSSSKATATAVHSAASKKHRRPSAPTNTSVHNKSNNKQSRGASRGVYGAAAGVGRPRPMTGAWNSSPAAGRQREWVSPEERERREMEVREGLKRAELELGSAHPRVGAHMFLLSRMVQERGDYAEAEKLCAKALEIYEMSLGPEHPDVGVALNCLALSWQAQVH